MLNGAEENKYCVLCHLVLKESKEICNKKHLMCRNCFRGYMDYYTKGKIIVFKDVNERKCIYDMPECPLFSCNRSEERRVGKECIRLWSLQ